jgi:RNA polymerase sigma factor (sigma-70 family)
MTVEQRNKWLTENERFVHKVCQPYRYRYDYEDVIQEAFVGAIAALDRVDDDTDEKLIRAYVSSYIDGYVRNNVIKRACAVNIPRYAYDQGVRLAAISIEWEYDSEESYESLYLPYEEHGYEEVDLMNDFMSAISALPEKIQKTALMLADGYERKDVAEVDGCSRQNINLRVKQIQEACKPLYA